MVVGRGRGSLLSCLDYVLFSEECTAALMGKLPPALRELVIMHGNVFRPEVFPAQLPPQLTTLKIFCKKPSHSPRL